MVAGARWGEGHSQKLTSQEGREDSRSWARQSRFQDLKVGVCGGVLEEQQGGQRNRVSEGESGGKKRQKDVGGGQGEPLDPSDVGF